MGLTLKKPKTSSVEKELPKKPKTCFFIIPFNFCIALDLFGGILSYLVTHNYSLPIGCLLSAIMGYRFGEDVRAANRGTETEVCSTKFH